MIFTIVNLGCKVNRVESDDAAAKLLSKGWEQGGADAAHLIIVNTCAVTGEAEKKTRKAVRQALRSSASARVVVTGCASALRPEAFEEMSDRVECVAKGDLAAWLDKLSDCGDAPAACPVLRVGAPFPTRVGVKVQDGCDNACTYCIVHVARGRAVSRPVDEVVSECVAYARAGVGEIVLTGINLGSYGRRVAQGPAVGLAELLEELLSRTEALRDEDGMPCRFRISSIEPKDVDTDLIYLIARADGRICRHLHLPLQSGSSKVLREMARPYDAGFFTGLVSDLRAAMPQLSLSTDIIAGFPGESEADFEETLSVARACGFSRIHAFPYSPRRGTPAAERADQLPPEVKEARAARLRALGNELRDEDFSRRVGTRELVLVEQDGRGMSESYYEVPVPVDAAPGRLIEVPLARKLD